MLSNFGVKTQSFESTLNERMVFGGDLTGQIGVIAYKVEIGNRSYQREVSGSESWKIGER